MLFAEVTEEEQKVVSTTENNRPIQSENKRTRTCQNV